MILYTNIKKLDEGAENESGCGHSVNEIWNKD